MVTDNTSLRVLVADDFAPVRERMVELLQELPHVEVVAETADVQDTIEQVRGLQPHAIILDISMPGGCGLDVLDRIRAECNPAMVVVLTNHSSPEYEAKALRGGAVAFLDKSRDFLKAVDYVGKLAERMFRRDTGSLFPANDGGADDVRSMVHSVRNAIRDFNSLADRQNAFIRASHASVFEDSASGDGELLNKHTLVSTVVAESAK